MKGLTIDDGPAFVQNVNLGVNNSQLTIDN